MTCCICDGEPDNNGEVLMRNPKCQLHGNNGAPNLQRIEQDLRRYRASSPQSIEERNIADSLICLDVPALIARIKELEDELEERRQNAKDAAIERDLCD